jgi:hypothetical protein
MSNKKFNFDYGDKKNITDNEKLQKDSYNNIKQTKKNNKLVFNDFSKTKNDLLQNNFDLSRECKYNIDVCNDIRKSKSSRFDSNDFDRNGNYIKQKKLLRINFSKFNDYTDENFTNFVPLNSLEDDFANI